MTSIEQREAERADEPRFTVSVPLRSADIDVLGHANHARYHEYLEEARSAFVREKLGTEPEGFVMARIELDHISELRFEEGEAIVALRVARVGESSITLEHELLTPGGRLVARGSSVLVAWDPERRAKRPLSASERSGVS